MSPSDSWHPFVLLRSVTSDTPSRVIIRTMKHKGNLVLIHFAELTVTSKIKKPVSNDGAHLFKCQTLTSPTFRDGVSRAWALFTQRRLQCYSDVIQSSGK